jgi:hypothetical protein
MKLKAITIRHILGPMPLELWDDEVIYHNTPFFKETVVEAREHISKTDLVVRRGGGRQDGACIDILSGAWEDPHYTEGALLEMASLTANEDTATTEGYLIAYATAFDGGDTVTCTSIINEWLVVTLQKHVDELVELHWDACFTDEADLKVYATGATTVLSLSFNVED